MNEDIVTGRVAAGVGALEQAAGEAVDSGKLRRKGAVRAAGGHAQAALGSAEDILGDAADRITASFAQLRDQSRAAMDRASAAARAVNATVDPFVRERPYAAVGLGLAVGLLAGLLIAGRGPKIIYVKPPAP
jgi:ElaB/YqjD/DUF883 family membrane-anchored ribosome-binding protein